MAYHLLHIRLCAVLFRIALMTVAIALISPSPGSARGFSEQDKQDIAKELSTLLPALDVAYTGAPVIVGDRDPIVFKLTPTGSPNFGELFGLGRYDIIYRPDDTLNLGAYLCHMAQEFVRKRSQQNASFLIPKFDLNIPVKYENIGFEIRTNEQTLAQIIYGILYLWDLSTNADYGRFRILIRGFADQGRGTVGTMLPNHPINKIVFLPPATPDQHMLFYLPMPQTVSMGSQFKNSDLPNLRATYLKEIIDAFLKSCALDNTFTTTSVVLDGAVIDKNNKDYRSIEIFFYGYDLK